MGSKVGVLRFVEREPLGPFPAGDCGGDYQSTDAWSRRFAAELPDGRSAVITVELYGEAAPGEGPQLSCRTEYATVRGSDVSDPDVSDYVDTRLSVGAPSEAEVRQACARFVLPADPWPAEFEWMLT